MHTFPLQQSSKIIFQNKQNGLSGDHRRCRRQRNTYGTIVGRIAPSKATFCRTDTDDTNGILTCYVGDGEFTNDKLDTFGGYGVMKIQNLQLLMQYICKMGFEHHVAVNISQTADAVAEALDNYMGWEVYRHY